jgi:hypothetical protein
LIATKTAPTSADRDVEAEPRQIEVFRPAAEKPHCNFRTGWAEYQEHCPGN